MKTVKKVLFRLDSGGKHGMGHLMRCKALADALIELNNNKQTVQCCFAVKTIHQDDAVSPHQLSYIKDENEFISLAKGFDLIVVDHYDYTSDLFYQLSLIEHSKLVVLDDECNRGQLFADIIINSSNSAINLDYKSIAPNALLLLGWQYVLLGSSFQNIQLPKFNKRDSILITFGGSDVKELTLPVIKKIAKSSLKNEKIVVVTGAGSKHLDEIEHYCLQHSFIYHHNVDNMLALFLSAKFAISAAGTTAYELACCGVPSVFAVVADNQLMSVSEQCKYGWCKYVDCREQLNADILIQMTELMIAHENLGQISNTALSLFDNNGSEKIAIATLNQID